MMYFIKDIKEAEIKKRAKMALRTVVYLLWWGCRMVGNLTIPPRICVIEL
jgi:hypothetical protein